MAITSQEVIPINCDFTIRTPISTVAYHLWIGIPVLVIGIGILIGEGDTAENILWGVTFLIPGIAFTFRGIWLRFWKCTIQGGTINYQTLFRRKTLTFYDITRVEQIRQDAQFAESGINLSFVGITLYSETGKLFRIHGSKEGFRAFVTRLEERNIPGVETLPTGIQWR